MGPKFGGLSAIAASIILIQPICQATAKDFFFLIWELTRLKRHEGIETKSKNKNKNVFTIFNTLLLLDSMK